MTVMTVKQERVALSGNEAVAEAMKQINPDVVAAFPITPSTEIPQYYSSFVANGVVDTEFVAVESEHSAMSAVIGAAAAGARAMTATSSAGLALMWEVVYVAASMRLPIVMPVVNRALTGPINIHCDHSDSMGARDSGWIQLYSENNQEVYDNMIQAIRISEHKDVLLPTMVCQDGFIISHALESMNIMDDNTVKQFVGEFKADTHLLDAEHPPAYGALGLQQYYFEVKRQQVEAMENAKKIILDVATEYEKISGRKYGFYEEYKMKDAEIAVIVLSSTAGTAKYVIDQLRQKGVKAGLIKLRVFRPFPVEELIQAVKGVKALAIMDRADTFSLGGGPLGIECKSAFYNKINIPIVNYIYGLGGRDTGPKDVKLVYEEILKVAQTGVVNETVKYVGLRE
jgi:pyruvate ferredoxin oxidoreductase alpha subunit